jgi:hypothetical protein
MRRTPNVVVALVVDMRASSQILNRLFGDRSPSIPYLAPYLSLIRDMESEIARYKHRHEFIPYKFTGDGWIVLFDANSAGAVLLDFIGTLSAWYESRSPRLTDLLNAPLDLHGLTFGLDNGLVKKVKMFERDEYIGRTIVIACRLQSAARDSTNRYAAYVSKWCYEKYFATVSATDHSVCFPGDPVPNPCKSIRVPLDKGARRS